MAFKLFVGDIEINDSNLTSIDFIVGGDDTAISHSKRSTFDLRVKGIITNSSEDPVKGLALWAMGGESIYRDVKAQVIDGNTLVREYTFTQAFVVNYEEDSSALAANGQSSFELLIRQNNSVNAEATVEGGFEQAE